MRPVDSDNNSQTQVEALGHTRHDSLPTGRTLGRERRAVAVITEKLIVLTGERLISKGALAAAAAEAALMEVAILIEQFLWGDKAGVLAPGLGGFIFGPLPPVFTYSHPFGRVLTLESCPMSCWHSAQVLAKVLS